jgi:SAM-dependent methyltransferase
MDDDTIKTQVRERYADIARNALAGKRNSCCESPSNLIPADLIGGAVPDEVSSTSQGCGTPLEIAKLQPGETVLDLGSGGGLDCFYASRMVGATGRVIGVDMTPEMLALANENAKKVEATNVEFRKGELERLPIDGASIDVIISNCVINLSPDKDRVFQEAFRVLKPGGRVAFSDMVTRIPMPEVLRSNMTSWAACISGAITDKDYLDKMRLAGFIDVAKVAGGENPIEPVYSAKIIARKPGDPAKLPQGWGEKTEAKNFAERCCG